VAWLVSVGLVAVLVVGFFASYAAAALAGVGAGGPAGWLLDPGPGGRWSWQATGWLAAIISPVGVLAAVAWGLVRRVRGRRSWTDHLAGAMTRRADLAELRPGAVAADTTRLGAGAAGTGLWLAKAVLTGEWLVAGYEWCQVWIMGPRAGKTRSVAVPQLVEHGGPAVATSNKPDIVSYTRGPRSELGRVWIFDPQGLYAASGAGAAGGDAGGAAFWWDPLGYVTDLERAGKLARMWIDSASTRELGHEDPFFGPAAAGLLRGLLMAAAAGGEPVTRVLTWLQFPDGAPGVPEPADLLRDAGFGAVGDDIDAVRAMVPETRDGIVAGAKLGVDWMQDPRFGAWVTPPAGGDWQPEFRPEEFVGSTDTIYLLSHDGPGTARALVLAITAALFEAGRDLATASGGRIRTPVLFMLDEAANIVRWAELPGLFSFSGSLGMILVVILQAKAQGEQCWGEKGFAQMWSAANVAFAGRGLRDERHLAELAALVGDRQRVDRSRTTGRGAVSSTASVRDERILSETDLLAMPRGRGILLVSGTRPILAELVDFSQRRDAARIEASAAAFGGPPAGGTR
jgi:hypothetical protein